MHGKDAGMAAESREQAKGAGCIPIVTLSGGMNQGIGIEIGIEKG